jgi:hypothetical protein
MIGTFIKAVKFLNLKTQDFVMHFITFYNFKLLGGARAGRARLPTPALPISDYSLNFLL